MFDHVGIAVSDLAASECFYRTVLSVLGVEPSHADAELVEWDDWDIGPTDRELPVTRGLHVGFRARDRAQVDAFWQVGVDAGYRDDGAPGPRTQYGPTYYGGYLLDPDGNSVEAVHSDREDAVPDGCVDHLWIRVRDPEASRHFYTTIAPHAGCAWRTTSPDACSPEARENLRRDLRRQARADKLKILTREYDDLVIAVLNRPLTDEREAEAFQTLSEAYEALDIAQRLGHTPKVASREHDESVAYCTVCNALGHADGGGEDLVLAGPLYCEPCPT